MYFLSLTGLVSEVSTAGMLQPAEALPLSPVKLIIFIAWIYSCFFFVQRVQFSPLISKNKRVPASIGALFLGPLFFLFLLLYDVLKSSSENRVSIIDSLKERFEKHKEAVVTDSEEGLKLLDTSGRSITEVYARGRKNKRQDNRIMDLTHKIISSALDHTASDILIDPQSDSIYTVRYRVDGVLRTYHQIDSDTCHAVINCIKAVANMDIAEKRRPQDGSFLAKTTEGTVSFRAASAGVRSGEKLTIRVLMQDASIYSLENVGLSDKQRDIVEAAIRNPSGMVLTCGPTGSGKTTSLYAMLNSIDLHTRNVVTVEDPIEYVLPNASQIEVNPKANITFATALRSILRQDPDVICIGEIRDEETAGIALRASQTGHLVLATIHASSNASALVRLLDLGVSPVMMASGLSIIVSQRLLRKLCEYCKKKVELTPAQIHNFHKKGVNCRHIFQGKGCEKCHDTGYRGRIAVFDMLPITSELKTSISQNDMLISELRKNGDRKGKSNLQKQALKKVVSGITSFEELKRVVGM
ncbi:MAG: GspE/PulE family protein [Planctomycetota bacterium]|jgi:type II secretory ATPase GspE/PulE/Tfp pilus assembly ATPase PilB-like protein